MAVGDAAIAAGFPLVPGSMDLREGYIEINRTRDMIAESADTGEIDAAQVTSGTLATARIPNLDAGKVTTGTLSSSRIPNLNADKITAGTIARTVSTSGSVRGDSYIASDDTYGRALTTSYRSVYTTADGGAYGYVASTRDVKNLLGNYAPNFQAWMDLEQHWYSYKDDEQQSPRLGLLAEDLNEFAPELVDHTDGKPDGIKYEMLPVALLGLIQQLAAEVEDLRIELALEPRRGRRTYTSTPRPATKTMKQAAARAARARRKQLEEKN